MQKKKANIEQLTAVIKKYKVVGSFFFCFLYELFLVRYILRENNDDS